MEGSKRNLHRYSTFFINGRPWYINHTALYKLVYKNGDDTCIRMESASKIMVVIKLFQLPTANLALKKQAQVCVYCGSFSEPPQNVKKVSKEIKLRRFSCGGLKNPQNCKNK
jgi:hypothetical protein